MFMMPSSSLRHGAQISGSINTPLFTSVSDTMSITYPTSEATQLPFSSIVPLTGGLTLAEVSPALLNGKVTDPGPGVIQRATASGGKSADVPQLANYVNARTKDGAKVYPDPFVTYQEAVVAWLAEPSLEVNPKNGLKYLTRTRDFVNDKEENKDISFVPDCNGALDSNGNPCPENAYLQTAGSSTLPCPGPAYPGASTATCGETFNETFDTAISEREYRNVQRQLANPFVSTSSSSSNFLTTRDWLGYTQTNQPF